MKTSMLLTTLSFKCDITVISRLAADETALQIN